MPTSTLQFISQIKLGELRRQRSLLLDAYDAIQRDAGSDDPVAGLKALFRGLHKVKVAGKPLHPDLGDIDILFRGAAPSAEVLAFWRQRLETELARGRLRADIVYLFGALLGEWGDEGASKQTFLDERRLAHATLLQNARTPAEEPNQDSGALLDAVFASFGDQLQKLPAQMRDAIAKESDREAIEVEALAALAENIHLPAEVRKEAKKFLADFVLQAQFRDALRIVTRDLSTWQWPADGVTTRALWTRNKWRLYANLSLVELCIVDRFGRFWSGIIENAFSDTVQRLNRLGRYHKLIDLKAPEVILENERRMLADVEKRVDLGWYEPIDPWDETPPVPAEGTVAGIVNRRAAEQGALRVSGAGGYYDGYRANRMLGLVNAEMRTLRAAYPDRPLFIVKLDIRDYFASIPHRVLIRMLQGLGLPAAGIEAIERYLAVPFVIDGSGARAERGVPMDQYLSHWLAEWLLRLMERHVHHQARVRILRQIDDICLLSPHAQDIVSAFEAVRAFLQPCGLRLNDDKSGALALGGELPAALPAARPRWGLLELTAEGEWGVHGPTFQSFHADARRHVSAKDALLAKVTLFNAYLRFLTSSLGLALDLGDFHRRAIQDALRVFEADFFAPEISLVEGLRQIIRERYLGDTRLADLPESWMVWPITAGGLSLRSSLVLFGQYQQAFRERRKKRVAAPSHRPARWQYADPAWTAFYEDHLTKIEPAKPKESKVMKTLVDDFIARGQEISAGKQQSLSDYWRWILALFGPEILDKFGTFRFLLTDLVPLQLIHERLMRETSLEE